VPTQSTFSGCRGNAADRHFFFVEGNSRREAAPVFGLSRETVLKMCRFSLPRGYVKTKPVEKPNLGLLLPVIDAILEPDRTGPAKHRIHMGVSGRPACAGRSGQNARQPAVQSVG
jgi:hypothetical protein